MLQSGQSIDALLGFRGHFGSRSRSCAKQQRHSIMGGAASKPTSMLSPPERQMRETI